MVYPSPVYVPLVSNIPIKGIGTAGASGHDLIVGGVAGPASTDAIAYRIVLSIVANWERVESERRRLIDVSPIAVGDIKVHSVGYSGHGEWNSD